MRTIALVLPALLLFAAIPVQADPSPAGNGYVMMIHATFEPHINDVLPVPPLPEAIIGTEENGYVIFHAIMFSTATSKPASIEAPRLQLAGPLYSMTRSPNGAADRVCNEESVGYGGTLAQCYVFAFPDWFFLGNEAVTVTLRFADARGPQVETYNAAAHAELHFNLQGAPGALSLQDNDALLTQPTPMVAMHLGPVGQ